MKRKVPVKRPASRTTERALVASPKAHCQVPSDPAAVAVPPPEKTPDRRQLEEEVALAWQKLTGTSTRPAAERFFHQAATAMIWPKPAPGEELLLPMAMFQEMEPQNATEAMLAVQMVAVHEAALMYLRRSTLEGQTTEAIDSNVTRAVRFMRLFKDQTEAMAKLKGTAGQQRVTVEHINVAPGAQAIIGPVLPAGGGGGKDGNG